MRMKAGEIGFGRSPQAARSKNLAVKAHKRMVEHNSHMHKKPVIGLKRQYHTKGGTYIGNYSGVSHRGTLNNG